MALKLKLLGAEKKPLSLKLGDKIKVELGSRIFKPLEVTENGTYVGGEENGVLVGFTPVTVNVNVEPKIEPLEVTENGTYNSNELDGYNPVVVNVKSTIEPLTVTENGVYSSEEVDGYKPVNVNVPVPSDTTAEVEDILEGKTAYIGGVKKTGILKGLGKKFTKGTVTFATKKTMQTITHNLGSIPSVFIMLAKPNGLNFTYGAEDAPEAGIYGFIWCKEWMISNYFTGETISPYNTGVSLEWRNTTNPLGWSLNTAGNGFKPESLPTETTITTWYRAAGFMYLANLEYEWIAIE